MNRKSPLLAPRRRKTRSVPLSQIVQAATRSSIGREILAAEMKRSGIKKGRSGSIRFELVESPKAMLDLLSPPKCSVEGCGGKLLAKGLCQKHYGRDRRGQPLEVEPRRGLVQLVIHVEPELKRWLKKTARRDKVSVSQRASTLLQSEMDNLNGKSPF